MAHGDAVIVGGVDGPAARHRGGARDDEALGLLLDLDAAGAQALDHQRDPVAFLDPHFAHAAHDGDAVGEGSCRGQDRIFVDHRGGAGFRHDHALQGRMAGGDVADVLAAGLTPVRYGQVGAHLDPGVEQASAQGVQHHPLDRHHRARHDQTRRQGEGGRGRIARHGDEGSGQRLTTLQRDRPALAHFFHADLGAEGAQHPFGVIATLLRLRHRGDALGVQASQKYGRLHLGRGHRLHIVDRRQRPAGQGDREPVLGRLPVEPGAHVGQRAGDALHRPLPQRGVAVEGGRQRIAGGRPHQQPHAGAGVAAIDHRQRRSEAARPLDPPFAVAGPLDLGAEGFDRAGGGQDVVAFQQTLDLGDAGGHAAQNHRAV